MYDQRMYHWVNSHELPLNGMKQQLLKLICDIFGGIYIQTGKSIWDPSMKARKLTRVIINGKASLGKEEVAAAVQLVFSNAVLYNKPQDDVYDKINRLNDS